MSSGIEGEEEIARRLRRSERLVERTSRQEVSEAERTKLLEEARRFGWSGSGLTPPYVSGSSTIDYNHLTGKGRTKQILKRIQRVNKTQQSLKQQQWLVVVPR